MVKFRIVEKPPLDYEEVKQDYLKGICGDKLRNKYGIGTSQYRSILKRFREDGIRTYRNNPQESRKPKWYRTITSNNNKKYYEVRRMFNKKIHIYGRYKSEQEAKNRVQELENNKWYGMVE